MNFKHTGAALLVVATTLITGCASTAPQNYSNGQTQTLSSGTIESIELTRSEANSSSGAGVVAGGLVGALLGNQVGSGSGRTAATLAGAVGGALVGNEVEKRNASAPDTYRINVRLDDGNYRSVMQDNVNDLRVGNRVRIIDGKVYHYYK